MVMRFPISHDIALEATLSSVISVLMTFNRISTPKQNNREIWVQGLSDNLHWLTRNLSVWLLRRTSRGFAL